MSLFERNSAPVLDQLREHWQKVATLLVWKLARSGVTITAEDLAAYRAEFDRGEAFLLTWWYTDSFEFRIVTEEEARRLAAHQETQKGHA